MGSTLQCAEASNPSVLARGPPQISATKRPIDSRRADWCTRLWFAAQARSSTIRRRAGSASPSLRSSRSRARRPSRSASTPSTGGPAAHRRAPPLYRIGDCVLCAPLTEGHRNRYRKGALHYTQPQGARACTHTRTHTHAQTHGVRLVWLGHSLGSRTIRTSLAARSARRGSR